MQCILNGLCIPFKVLTFRPYICFGATARVHLNILYNSMAVRYNQLSPLFFQTHLQIVFHEVFHIRRRFSGITAQAHFIHCFQNCVFEEFLIYVRWSFHEIIIYNFLSSNKGDHLNEINSNNTTILYYTHMID